MQIMLKKRTGTNFGIPTLYTKDNNTFFKTNFPGCFLLRSHALFALRMNSQDISNARRKPRLADTGFFSDKRERWYQSINTEH